MLDLFPNSLDAINNSHYLAKRCKSDWSFINTIFPGLSLKNTFQANRKLKKYTYQGASIRYGEITSDIEKIEKKILKYRDKSGKFLKGFNREKDKELRIMVAEKKEMLQMGVDQEKFYKKSQATSKVLEKRKQIMEGV